MNAVFVGLYPCLIKRPHSRYHAGMLTDLDVCITDTAVHTVDAEIKCNVDTFV